MKLGRKGDRTRAALLPPSFSITERRVGSLVGAGHPDQAIAERLRLSVQTVEWTVANALPDARCPVARRARRAPGGVERPLRGGEQGSLTSHRRSDMTHGNSRRMLLAAGLAVAIALVPTTAAAAPEGAAAVHATQASARRHDPGGCRREHVPSFDAEARARPLPPRAAGHRRRGQQVRGDQADIPDQGRVAG